MLVSDFMMNSMLKILKNVSVECMECLNEDAKKKKGQILCIGVGTIKSLPVPNCLILHTSLIDSVVIDVSTNEYQWGKAGFSGGVYKVFCYV